MSESPEFDRYASGYKELVRDPVRDKFAADATFFHERKWILLRDFYARKRQSTLSLKWLDVGCGEGDLLNFGRGAFGELAGCDFSSEMLKETSGLDVRTQTDPDRLPFEDAGFDLTTAVCVFHHVEPHVRLGLILEMKRVLRPGGLLCLIEHNAQNPVVRGIVKRAPVDANAILLKSSECEDLFRQAGLELLETEFFLYLPQAIYKRLGGLEVLGRRVPIGGQYACFARKK